MSDLHIIKESKFRDKLKYNSIIWDMGLKEIYLEIESSIEFIS